jgi:hypothetical protein
MDTIDSVVVPVGSAAMTGLADAVARPGDDPLGRRIP